MKNLALLAPSLALLLPSITALPASPSAGSNSIITVTGGTPLSAPGTSPNNDDVIMGDPSTPEVMAKITRGVLEARGDQIGCTDNFVDADTAQEAHDAMCSNSGWVNWDGVLWSCAYNHAVPSIGAFVYECNYASYQQPCKHEELDVALQLITQKCGLNKGGWWHSGAWNKTYGIDTLATWWCQNMPGVYGKPKRLGVACTPLHDPS